MICWLNLDSLAKLVADRPGRSASLTHRQVRETLRLLGEVIRLMPPENQQKLFLLLKHGNKVQMVSIEQGGADEG